MDQTASALAFATLLSMAMAGPTASANEHGMAKPELIRREVVQGMPQGDSQEIRVLTATFQPGDRTVFHTHRSPVTVYVLEGQFTLELEGRPTVTVRAGEAYVEPPHIRMTGFNRSGDQPLKVLIFYVSDPGTPFLDESR